MKKAVIVLSGGMDSGVLLADLTRQNCYEIHALTFNYGSNHNPRENECAKKLAEKYGCKSHKVVMLPFIKETFDSSLLQGAEAIPEGHYAEESMKSTVVPFRNGIMLSIAAGYAESIKAELLFIGNHAGDHFIYPDCRPDFIEAMRETIKTGTFKNILLLSPYCDIDKRAIGKLGKVLNFDFSETYTCYKGDEKHCGVCGSCTERKEALEGFDTTEYKE
jgi:7-cyano-7-deazaguanine synthase